MVPGFAGAARVVRVLESMVLALLLAAAGPRSCPAQTPSPSPEQRQQAQDLYRQGRAAAEAAKPDYAAAIAAHEKALALDPTRALYVVGLADAYWGGGRLSEVVPLLSKWRETFVQPEERRLLTLALAKVEQEFGNREVRQTRWPAAATHYAAAARYFGELGQKPEEAHARLRLGDALAAAADIEKAAPQHQRALDLYRQAGDTPGQIEAGTALGEDLRFLQRRQEALANFHAAQKLIPPGTMPYQSWRIQKGLGDLYMDAADLPAARAAYSAAWKFAQADTSDAAGSRTAQRTALKDLANVYEALGQVETAIQYLQQALPLCREGEDDLGKAAILNGLAKNESKLGRDQEAIGHWEAALPLFRAGHDTYNVVVALGNLANQYLIAGQNRKAADAIREVLDLAARLNDLSLRYQALATAGNVFLVAQKYDAAADAYRGALLACRLANLRRSAIDTQALLMGLALRQKQPRLAAFWGKETVNGVQAMRATLREVDKEIQRAFLKTEEWNYRDLAALLLDQQRLPEALQMLNLLKQEGYLNQAPAPGAEDDSALWGGEAALTPRETQWHARLLEAQARLERVTVRWHSLTTPPAAPSAADLKAARQEADQASSAFEALLETIAQDFATPEDRERDRLEQVADARDLQQALHALGGQSVVVYTLAADKALYRLLVTPEALEMHRADVAFAELSRNVEAFRRVLSRPTLDPRPQGKVLFDLLVGPLQGALERVGAQTILWSLDRNLRTIPMAALSPDGKGYLLEKYGGSLFTPASLAQLTRPAPAHWRGLGLGVSQSHGTFPALAAVPAELQAVVRDGNTTGILPGTILLDRRFTRATMLAELAKGYSLVHIASHFHFEEDADRSFLLLGDGTRLTLTEIKALPPSLFAGVDLLTLSACQTALGTPDNVTMGRDLENFAVLAQRKGVRAILATLWSVADKPTQRLMTAFYRLRQSQPGMSKAEALRRAQLSLLTGSEDRKAQDAARRGTEPVPGKGAGKVFAPPRDAPYAHPYYWAPFTLVGNWQ